MSIFLFNDIFFPILWSDIPRDWKRKVFACQRTRASGRRTPYVPYVHGRSNCRFLSGYYHDTVPKLSPEERYGSTDQVKKVIESLNAVLSHVMTPDVDEKVIYESDRHIRMFLHNLEQLDTVVSKERKKSKLQSSYSFLASLQLVDVMKDYGSLRNVWEGTYIGEGILSKIKPLVTDLRKNWHINAGQKYNRIKSINKILHQYSSKQDILNLIGRNYCTYVNDNHARDLFNNEKPLSCVCLNNGEFAVILSLNKMITLN